MVAARLAAMRVGGRGGAATRRAAAAAAGGRARRASAARAPAAAEQAKDQPAPAPSPSKRKGTSEAPTPRYPKRLRRPPPRGRFGDACTTRSVEQQQQQQHPAQATRRRGLEGGSPSAGAATGREGARLAKGKKKTTTTTAKRNKATAPAKAPSRTSAHGGATGARAGVGASAGATRAHELAAVRRNGCKFVVGADEAGRGPLAGPVVAAACHVPLDVTIDGIGDSKVLSEEERERVFAALQAHPDVHFAATVASSSRIDDVNILQASLEAMAKSVARLRALGLPVDYALVDGNRMPKWMPCPTETVVKGDAKSIAIAAASVVAKVTRDRLMVQYDAEFPAYGFKQHKGYPVPEHMRAVYKAGPCPIHRVTFAPIKHRPEVQDRLAAIHAARVKRKEEDAGQWWHFAAEDEATWAATDP